MEKYRDFRQAGFGAAREAFAGKWIFVSAKSVAKIS
jgi:hypothetical protein